MRELFENKNRIYMRLLISTLLLLTITVSTYATQEKKSVRLRIQSPYGNLDETTVYFDQGVSSAYGYQEDAQKVLSGVAGVPVIYTVTSDNIHCSINGYNPLSSTQLVPVGISVDMSGTYNITCPLMDNFDPTSIVTLEDRTLGVSTDLRTNFYQAQIDTADAPEGRFFIRVTMPSSFASTIAGCNNNDAEVSVTTDPVITWDSYKLFSASNDSIGTFTNVNSTVTFTNLAQGDYYLIRTYGAYSTTQDLHIAGTHITVGIGATALQVATYENITFSALAVNANHFSWDFGDGTLITGVANPDLAYYEPGVYTVNLHCSNDNGCAADAQVQVIVSQSVSTGIKEDAAKDIVVSAIGKTLNVNIPDALSSNAQVQIYNLLGQPIYNAPLYSQKTTVTFDEHPLGYYLVSVKNNNKVSTKRVFIGN